MSGKKTRRSNTTPKPWKHIERPPVLRDWVHVGQGEAALVLQNRTDIKYIATYGLGPCVGVLVVGAIGVGLAHIDSESVSNANKLAQYAKGTINDPSKVYIASAINLPQPGNSGDRTSTEIYDQIKEVFPNFEVIISSEIAWDFIKKTVVTKFNIEEQLEALKIGDVPHWRLEPSQFEPNNPYYKL